HFHDPALKRLPPPGEYREGSATQRNEHRRHRQNPGRYSDHAVFSGKIGSPSDSAERTSLVTTLSCEPCTRSASAMRITVSAKLMTIAVSINACGTGSAEFTSCSEPSGMIGGNCDLNRPVWKIMTFTDVVSSDRPSSMRTMLRESSMKTPQPNSPASSSA